MRDGWSACFSQVAELAAGTLQPDAFTAATGDIAAMQASAASTVDSRQSVAEDAAARACASGVCPWDTVVPRPPAKPPPTDQEGPLNYQNVQIAVGCAVGVALLYLLYERACTKRNSGRHRIPGNEAGAKMGKEEKAEEVDNVYVAPPPPTEKEMNRRAFLLKVAQVEV